MVIKSFLFSYYAIIVSETPKPKDLIKVADKISARLSDATDLQMFGYELLEEDAVLQAQRDTLSKGQGLREFCLKLLQRWKGSKENPTWDDVIRALREIEQRELAQMIEKAKPQQAPGIYPKTINVFVYITSST